MPIDFYISWIKIKSRFHMNEYNYYMHTGNESQYELIKLSWLRAVIVIMYLTLCVKLRFKEDPVLCIPNHFECAALLPGMIQ